MVSEFLYISCKRLCQEFFGFRPKEEAMDERFWLKGIAGIEREKSKKGNRSTDGKKLIVKN